MHTEKLKAEINCAEAHECKLHKSLQSEICTTATYDEVYEFISTVRLQLIFVFFLFLML